MAMMAARVKVKHSIRVSIALAAVTALLDVDHFFGFTARATFHNIFVVVVFPLILFLIFLKKGNKQYMNLSLALLLFLVSHPIVDMFTEGGVAIFYPISEQKYDLSKFSLPMFTAFGQGYVISTAGVGLTIYFLLVLGVIFIEDLLNYFREDKTIEYTFGKTVKKEEKKIEKEL
jgi:membrane-bound metal-dependent hydrolase YbcI (DUF457 family)